MNTKELYWLVGWLEGEGSFLAGSPSKPNSCKITAITTDRDIADRVAKIFHTKVLTLKKRLNDPSYYKQQYRVSLNGHRAAILMLKLKRKMGFRRSIQIEKALENFKMLNKQTTKKQLAQVHKLIGRNLSYRAIEKITGISRTSVGKIKHGIYKYLFL